MLRRHAAKPKHCFFAQEPSPTYRFSVRVNGLCLKSRLLNALKTENSERTDSVNGSCSSGVYVLLTDEQQGAVFSGLSEKSEGRNHDSQVLLESTVTYLFEFFCTLSLPSSFHS